MAKKGKNMHDSSKQTESENIDPEPITPLITHNKTHANHDTPHSSFSRRIRFLGNKKLLIFIITFGVIGSYFLIKSFAATNQIQYTFQKNDFGVATGSGWSTDTAQMEKSLYDFKALGVRYIRFNIPWSNFQAKDPSTLTTGQSKYNWRNVDFLISELKKPQFDGQFRLIVTIGNPPDWAYAKVNNPAIPCPNQPPFNLQAFADASRDLAMHLYSVASIFEIQNSPNIGHSTLDNDQDLNWDIPNPCGYTQLLKRVYPAIHTVRPFSTVLVGGIGVTKTTPGYRTASDEFLYQLYIQGAKNYFDGVAWHSYSYPNLPCDPAAPICKYNPGVLSPYGPYRNGFDRMLNGRNVMVYFGDSAKKIFITEYGAPNNAPDIANQIALLTAVYQRASQFDWIATTCWYTYMDKENGAGATMGLADINGNLKPYMVKAYTDLSKQDIIVTP